MDTSKAAFVERFVVTEANIEKCLCLLRPLMFGCNSTKVHGHRRGSVRISQCNAYPRECDERIYDLVIEFCRASVWVKVSGWTASGFLGVGRFRRLRLVDTKRTLKKIRKLSLK